MSDLSQLWGPRALPRPTGGDPFCEMNETEADSPTVGSRVGSWALLPGLPLLSKHGLIFRTTRGFRLILELTCTNPGIGLSLLEILVPVSGDKH